MNDEDQNIVGRFYLAGYQEGLIHGFTLGRAKPPRPEDSAIMERMLKVMKDKLEEEFKQQKGISDGNSEDLA